MKLASPCLFFLPYMVKRLVEQERDSQPVGARMEVWSIVFGGRSVGLRAVFEPLQPVVIWSPLSSVPFFTHGEVSEWVCEGEQLE